MPTPGQLRPAPRPLRPEDLYRLKVPTQPRLSPDGSLAVFVVQTALPDRRGYRHAIWGVPTDGSAAPRQLTLGAEHDSQPRISADGRRLGFLSDRRTLVEAEDAERRSQRSRPTTAGAEKAPDEDRVQVHALPLDGPGEAVRLTDLPRGVTAFEWSPDGRRLAVLSASAGATRDEDRRRRGIERRQDEAPPTSDYRFLDRVSYLLNGEGFVYDRRAQLWVVDLATGEARRLTDGPAGVDSIAWSPDGRRIAYACNAERDFDLLWRMSVWSVEVESGRRTRLSPAGRSYFHSPAWLPDGSGLAVLGHRFEAHVESRQDIWLLAADGSDATSGGRNLSAVHDLMPGSAMNSDVTVGEPARLVPSPDGAWITFSAPLDGSYELWRISTEDGGLERLTADRHYVSSFDAVARPAGRLLAFVRSSATELPDVFALAPESEAGARRLTSLNADALAGVDLVEPVERCYMVEGRQLQSWLLEPAASTGFARPGPLVVEIHGGPATQYGWAPFLEFQILAGQGMAVWYSNPRGSTGYGQEFVGANWRDWGDGPMRDVLAGVDALLADGIADPDRLGVTGGSYGGYLTNWIVGHDQRFRAAITCRSVSDLTTMLLTGDLAGVDIVEQFGTTPWDDPEFYRQASPISHIAACRTPLLIQHAENDLRCAIGQAEELFAVLRANRRPVRLMRVPGESHELTRSGTPFRRAENLARVGDWFGHYLLKGRRGLPPLPRDRGDK